MKITMKEEAFRLFGRGRNCTFLLGPLARDVVVEQHVAAFLINDVMVTRRFSGVDVFRFRATMYWAVAYMHHSPNQVRQPHTLCGWTDDAHLLRRIMGMWNCERI